MAQVWRGTDLVLGRTVAIKLLHPHLAEDPSFVERFRREAQAAARLNDQHIVAIFDRVTEGRQSALILQYVDGTTLRDRLRQGPLSTAVAAGICAQVAAALEVAHAAGIVHRDVKPGNVLLCTPDSTEEAASPVPRVRVTDFGIAKALEDEAGPDLTSANTVMGTAKYLAPEQVEGGPVDARTDVFAVGVMLYEAVAGRAPWLADTDLATALCRLTAEPIPVGELQPDVDPELDRIISRAIARRPEDRFQSATELRSALQVLARNAATGGPDGAPKPEADEFAKDHPPAAVTTAPEATASHGDTAQLSEPTAIMERHRSPGSAPRWRRMATAALAAGGLVAGLAAWVGRDESTPSDSAAEQSGPGSTVDGSTIVEGAPLTGLSPLSYDVYGDRTENDDLVGAAVDGVRGPSDSAEVWRSQCYRDDPLPKRGFGLILESRDLISLSGVELVTRHAGWRADVYVSTSSGNSLKDQLLESWGPVRAQLTADTSTATAPLHDIEGRSVLVFFTSLAGIPLQECFDQGRTYRLDVIEASLYGKP